MPAKFWAVRRALRSYEHLKLEERTGKGSHIVIRDQHGHTFPLSLHRGEHSEISEVYLRGLCRVFLLDYDDFRKRL